MLINNYFHREMAKYKKSLLTFVIILFPIIAGSIEALAMSKMFKSTPQENIWEVILVGNKIQSIWMLICICLMAIISSLIISIDKDNKTFKIIFSTVMKKEVFYLEKLLTLSIFTFIVVFLYIISSVVISKIIFVQSSIPYEYIGKIILKEFISLMGLGAVQLFMSLYLKNILEAIAIGISGSIVGLGIIAQKPIIACFIPYCYPYSILLKNEGNIKELYMLILSVLYFVIISFIGVKKIQKVNINEVE